MISKKHSIILMLAFAAIAGFLFMREDTIALRAEVVSTEDGKIILQYPEITCFFDSELFEGNSESGGFPGMVGAEVGDIVYTTIWQQKRYWAVGASNPYRTIPWDDVKRNNKKFIKGEVVSIEENGKMCVKYGIEEYRIDVTSVQSIDFKVNGGIIAFISLDEEGNTYLEDIRNK